MLTRAFLRRYWSKAQRKGVLYKALTGENRRYLWWMMKTFDEISSVLAVRIILKILKKLMEALKSPFVKAMETDGYERARKLAEQAVEWGHKKAKRWAMDPGFSRYLTFLDFNKPSVWGV